MAEGARTRGPHPPQSARETLAGNLGRDPYEGVDALREIGERKARAEGVAYQLEKERDAVLARLSSEYASAHAKENLSEAKLKRLAEADPRYGEHLRKTAEAVTERERVSSEYWAVKSELEWDQEALRHLNHLSRLGG
jgi:DNA repair ATPase RecN